MDIKGCKKQRLEKFIDWRLSIGNNFTLAIFLISLNCRILPQHHSDIWAEPVCARVVALYGAVGKGMYSKC